MNPAIYYRVDSLGNVLATYTVPGPDAGTDNHEFRVLPDGDVMFMGAEIHVMDLTAYDAGASVPANCNTVYRLHADGGVAFFWDSFDYTTPADIDPNLVWIDSSPLDATHTNSIDVTSDGNYLVSSRDMSQVWKIDSQTGAMIWRLGYHGDFTFVNDPLGGFSGQHYARELAPNDILLFDDGNSHLPVLSRSAEYKLELATGPDGGAQNTATLVWSYTPEPSIFAFAEGSAQRLSNGNTLVAYGGYSRLDEVDANGNLVWQLIDEGGDGSFYRAQLIDSLY